MIYYSEGAIQDELHLISEKLGDAAFFLLEKYAPLLFDEVPEELDLSQTLEELARMTERYYSDSRNYRVFDRVMSHYHGSRREKAEAVRLELLQREALKLSDTLGRGVSTPKAKKLQDLLEDLLQSPEEYLLPRTIYFKPTLEPIREFLLSLHLPNKQDIITSFIAALNLSK